METKPQWFKVRYNQEAVEKVTQLMDELELNTVCNEASCPNMGECYSSGTATFMILGRVCTRSCRFCDVTHGRPDAVNEKEPQQLAQAVKKMGLEYVVITSVDRDDLPDYGAGHFAKVIEEVRKHNPHTMIEVLTPDFQGDQLASIKSLRRNPTCLTTIWKVCAAFHRKSVTAPLMIVPCVYWNMSNNRTPAF